MEVNSSAEMRQRAIDWLNSKDRDLSSGIAILDDAGYKPHVMKIFREKIGRQDIPGKLLLEVRSYLRYFAKPEAEEHKDVVSSDLTDEAMAVIEADRQNEYPEDVKKVISELSAIYKARGGFHTQLTVVGEGNTQEQKTERVKLLALIKACSDRITVLSESYNKFKADGTIPSAELVADCFDPEKVKVENPEEDKKEPEKEFELAATIEELKKQSDNWRIKVYRAECKLEFQVEKKLDKTNPMPEGPKRVKLINRIAQLKAEKEQIDMAIANWK